MTTLMYPGFAHEGTHQPRPVAKYDLIYRGVRHTGRAERDLKSMQASEMIYRGVRSVRTPKSSEPLFGEIGAAFPSSVVRPGQSGRPSEGPTRASTQTLG